MAVQAVHACDAASALEEIQYVVVDESFSP
jgi:hypothetical protein